MDTLPSSCAYRKTILASLLLAALACACGGAEDTMDPGANADPVPTDSGRFLVAVQPDPNPAIRGVNTVHFTITDATGALMSDVPLEVLPWMPAHNHGTSVDPVVTSLGNGEYRAENVYFFMAGHWELRTTLGPNDHLVPTFDVP